MSPKRIAIVTDAWEPKVNGVVRSIQAVNAVLEREGHEVAVISPDLFHSLPCPTYPEIRLALTRVATVGAMLEDFAPDVIHLATEGPLCIAGRLWCLRHKRLRLTRMLFEDKIASMLLHAPRKIRQFVEPRALALSR